MNEHSEKDIAVAWITNQETWWAWETVDNTCRDNPERGWHLVMAILAATESSHVIGCLGAGPLEDLLAKYGDVLIGRAEELAKTDTKFRECLASTWQNAMSQDIWTRVCRATNRDDSNPNGHSNPT